MPYAISREETTGKTETGTAGASTSSARTTDIYSDERAIENACEV